MARAEQFWTDAFNVLCCTGYLTLAVCANANEMIGMKLNKLPTAIRDIHTKCNELLICLLLRGTPLQELYQVLKHSVRHVQILICFLFFKIIYVMYLIFNEIFI